MEELGIVDDQLVKEFDKLPADFWDFKNEDTKELTHSIHNYPAVMVYPISRNIISIVKKYQNIESLLDPFMGSGTVLLEGILANIEKVYGNDLNPLAHRISKAKTTLIGDEIVQYRDKLVFDLEKEYEKYDKILNMVTGYVDEAGYDITAKVLDKDNWGENAPGILNEYLDNYLYKIVLE
ncbi:MAG: DNA adenine methylase [Anaerobutyricum soehngenii]